MKAFLKLGVLALTLTASIWAAPMNISTGFVPAGPNGWKVDGVDATTVTGGVLNVWVAAPADSAWVSNSTSGFNLPSPPNFLYTLNIGALVGDAGSFSGLFSSDNDVVFAVTNGGTVTPNGCTGEFCYQTLQSVSGTFNANSVLTATVSNRGNQDPTNPTGFLLSASAEGSGIPEPGTYAMMILGGAAIALARLRRK